MKRITTGLGSMGWKIQGWYAVILTVVVSGLMVMLYRVEHQRQLMVLNVEVEAMIQHVLPEITPRARAGRPGGGAGPRRPGGSLPRGPRMETGSTGDQWVGAANPGQDARPGPKQDPGAAEQRRGYTVQFEGKVESGGFVRVWNDDESILFEEGEVPEGLPYREVRMRTAREPFGDYRTVWKAGPQRRTIVAGMPQNALDASMAAFRNELIVYGVAIVSVVMLIGLLVVRRSLRPVKEISGTAEEISRGDLSRRIDVAGGCTELASLGKVLNECFGKLEENFTQQQRFTADASHELRTPVSVLLSTSQRMLAKDRSAQENREAFQVCERSAIRMKRLVDELTELARFDSGEVRLVIEEEDLGILAECIAGDLQPMAAERDVTIRCDLSPAFCRMDVKRIEQVLTNLVMNAIRHNPESVIVSLKTWEEGDMAFLEVSDDGKGIAPEDQQHLFDRFYQVDSNLGRKSSGSGLGLAICKVIVDRHGGTIEVDSEPGRGTCFRIGLPKARE